MATSGEDPKQTVAIKTMRDSDLHRLRWLEDEVFPGSLAIYIFGSDLWFVFLYLPASVEQMVATGRMLGNIKSDFVEVVACIASQVVSTYPVSRSVG